MLGSLILYLKGMRRMMFQLSGFYCTLGAHGPTRVELLQGRVQGILVIQVRGFRV